MSSEYVPTSGAQASHPRVLASNHRQPFAAVTASPGPATAANSSRAEDLGGALAPASETSWLLAGLAAEDLTGLAPVVERLVAGSFLSCDDERPQMVRVLLEGWAYAATSLGDNRRQILSLMFADDLASFWTPLRGGAPAVRALTACRVLAVRRDALQSLAVRQPVVDGRLADRARVDVSVMHAWLANLGQRKAPERIAHLFCELGHRLMHARRRGAPAPLSVPLTQQDLADVVGMTSVHVNRVLQRLRAHGLVDVRKGGVRLRDLEGLARICDFDPAYLGGVSTGPANQVSSSPALAATMRGTSP